MPPYTLKKQHFSGVSRGYKFGTLGRNKLINILIFQRKDEMKGEKQKFTFQIYWYEYVGIFSITY